MCTRGRRGKRGGAHWERVGGRVFPSPPTSIGQDPADVDGEVFEGEDEEGREGEGSTPEKETRVLVVRGQRGDESMQCMVIDCAPCNTFGGWGKRQGGIH